LKNSKTTQEEARYIATEEFLLEFPESARKCSGCRKDYEDGEKFEFELCDKHTFCLKCFYTSYCPCNPRKPFGMPEERLKIGDKK